MGGLNPVHALANELVGSGQANTVMQVAPAPKAVAATPDQDAQEAAKRRAAASKITASGRSSTVLAAGDSDKLGG